MDKKSSFAEMMEQERANRKSDAWSGTFLEYLEKLRADSSIARMSHARVHDLVKRRGATNIQEMDDPRLKRLFGDETIKVYDFFKDEFFGIERALAQIVRYFHSAALHGEESRQVLYLMGPVGAGKSSIMDKLQRGLEEADAVYAIEGCPMREEPLHLIAPHLRKEFEKMLEVHIEGDLCPVCRWRLEEEFKGKAEEVPIVTVPFSRHGRCGIGVVPPVDPNNQDTSVLIGSEDISKLDIYSEGDPRVLDLNGAFNVGNRGITEVIVYRV